MLDRTGGALLRDAYVLYLEETYGPQVTGLAVQDERKVNAQTTLVYKCRVAVAQITFEAVWAAGK